MSTCLVSAKDFREHFEVTCPECRHTSREPQDFAVWFCPSTPDRCDGCEIDPTCRRCPECQHEWRRDV